MSYSACRFLINVQRIPLTSCTMRVSLSAVAATILTPIVTLQTQQLWQLHCVLLVLAGVCDSTLELSQSGVLTGRCVEHFLLHRVLYHFCVICLDGISIEILRTANKGRKVLLVGSSKCHFCEICLDGICIGNPKIPPKKSISRRR